jgi:iron complex transport system ATP-binding protein
MLTVENIHFSYGKYQILDDISFNVQKGELCGLFGPNGCGKTTLFKCCLNFLKIKKGFVFIAGKKTEGLTAREMAGLVAYVPQEHKPPFPYLVKEIVLMGRTPHLNGIFGISRAHKRKALEALELLDIMNLADRAYNRLSGGQRQMVLIARAIAQESKLIFLDEPTAALDFKNQIIIWKIMHEIKKQGVTILACSHDPNHVSWYCDNVIVMNNSKILAHGHPNEVITEPVLDSIYKQTCSVKNINGIRTVLPREVANNSENHY